MSSHNHLLFGVLVMAIAILFITINLFWAHSIETRTDETFSSYWNDEIDRDEYNFTMDSIERDRLFSKVLGALGIILVYIGLTIMIYATHKRGEENAKAIKKFSYWFQEQRRIL